MGWGGSGVADMLAAAICDHFTLFIAAYGADAIKPKHHYALHLPRMLATHGVLVGTFTHERKHRVVKRNTRDRMNLTKWDLGSLEEITVHQLKELGRTFIRSGFEY